MPTPVGTAKQCLNTDASHALEEAVALTRRRGHAQTTSLHAVAAFLSVPSSQLREACMRARNTAVYPPRVQLKALDFCLSVALERLPASSEPRVDEPPVSNSLMAAIKRSQANQRRMPESIIAVRNQNQVMGSQCQEQFLGSSCSGIKVELEHLIVSILDDPIVSRVFNDAGFRNFDVKLAILRPFQSFFRYRGNQGLFMCSSNNLDEGLNPGHRPFRFPFSGNCDWGEDYKRIGEILVRKKGRNPLLVGVCANDSLRGFVEVLEGSKEVNILPLEAHGIKVISFEKDLLKFVNENWSDEAMNSRFKEVGMMIDNCLGPGLMVCFGNLRYFLGGENGFGIDVLKYIVRSLTKLLEDHGDRVWLIGFATNDQTYMDFLSRFPSTDNNWDLNLLPITRVKPLAGGESCFKSSLMGSFVPFGGFFSSPSDMTAPVSNSYQTNTFPRRGFTASLDGQHKSTLSPWLQIPEPPSKNAPTDIKAIDGKMLLGDSDEGFQRKKDSYCNFQSNTNIADIEKHSTSHSSKSIVQSSSKNDAFLAKQSDSPTSGVSVITELGLELFPNPHKQQKKQNSDLPDKSHSPKSLRSDFDNFKTLFEALFGIVGRQSEAVRKISQIITDSRGDIWLNLVGPDPFGKRKVAIALAKILYENENNIVCVNFFSKHGHQMSNEFDIKFRGKTVVDHIAEELRRTPFGVVCLENVHFADPVAQRSLLKAIKTGKFSDSHGREVPINNKVFVLTSEEDSTPPSKERKSNFLEERIARVKDWPIQVTVMNTKNKKKRAHMESGMSLDLNLPAEINDDYENDRRSESWLDEFSNEVVKVVFDPFDYDALSTKILKWVHQNLCKTFGFECSLEIEPRVMEQMLATACLSSEGESEVENWVDCVLGKGFADAQKRYQLSLHSVITVSSCGPLYAEVKSVETCFLPSKIVLM